MFCRRALLFTDPYLSYRISKKKNFLASFACPAIAPATADAFAVQSFKNNRPFVLFTQDAKTARKNRIIDIEITRRAWPFIDPDISFRINTKKLLANLACPAIASATADAFAVQSFSL
ncbi:hypothetical protein ACFL7M_12510 [Thermodesulfobacteriota bacterium]